MLIEPNDTMKMAIGKEAILQRTFNIKNFSLSYNALSVNCEHDWKVSATIHLTALQIKSPRLQFTILAFDLQALLCENLLSTKCI